MVGQDAVAAFHRAADLFAHRRATPSPERVWLANAHPHQIPPDTAWRVWLLLAGRGAGKALALDTPIPTPDGWTTMGAVKTGDRVFDEAGRPCTVTATFDTMADVAYRFTFSDGSTLDACSEHQWVTWTHADRKAFLRSKRAGATRIPEDWPNWRAGRGVGPRVRTSQEIVDTLTRGVRGGRNHSIPVAGPLELPDADLPLDPYLLGVGLGDGDGHVPGRYLRASRAQRLALLQGLMDSGGYADSKSVEFCATNRGLADAVFELAASLGQKPVLAEGRGKYRVTWRPTLPVFRLARKLDRQPSGTAQVVRHHHRMIVSAERIEPQRMRCITVDAPNSMYLAGRAMIPTHNTRAVCEWGAGRARRYPKARIALVAATFADGRDTLVEGESGLLSVFDPVELRGGSVDRAWNRSLGELYLANGSKFKIYSAEKPRQLRGPQHHFAVADELAFWPDADKGTARDTTWSNLNIGTRLPARKGWPAGYRSQIAVATTPRPVALLWQRSSEELTTAPGLMQKDTTVVVRGRTVDNLANLSDEYLREVVEPMEGTRLGRQELDGELLFDVEGALWSLDQLDADRVKAAPELYRVVVGVDPAVTANANSDETGIVVAGLDKGWRLGGHGYVLADYSGRMTPSEWGLKVCRVAIEHDADAIVAEKNQGHDLVVKLVRDSWQELEALGETGGRPMPRVIPVNSSVGKRLRAEPISAQYEQHRWHHLTGLARMEDQMTSWVPGNGDSPDRVDALVHAATELTTGAGGPAEAVVPPSTPIPGVARPVPGLPGAGVPAGVQVVPSLGDLRNRR